MTPLDAARDLVDQALPRIGIERDVDLVYAEDWGMEPGETFTIYCPGGKDHVLLHYLAHAAMLEQGWKQPVLRGDTRVDFLLANRSTDTFTDFWAYHLVADLFGTEHVIAYTDWLMEMEAEKVVDHLEAEQDRHGFDEKEFERYCHVFLVDWFGMAPALTRPYRKRRAENLIALGTDVIGMVPADSPETVTAVRSWVAEQPSEFRAVLERQEERFATYYGTVWDEPPGTVEGFMALEEIEATGLNQ